MYMSICRRRCLVTAEARCYEAIIKSIPKETNETLDEDEETIIEEN